MELLASWRAMETSANRRRRPARDFLPGTQDWLTRRHVASTRPSGKLDVRKLGPFPVLARVGTSAYRLDLPTSLKIHPVFHVSLLEPHVGNPFPGRQIPPPPPLVVDGEPEYEVASVLDSRVSRGQLQYLVD